MKRTTAIVAILGLLLSSHSINASEIKKDIVFERGKNSSTINGSVMRGDRDVYLLRAHSGQTMSVKVSALESNVALSIYQPKASEPISGTEEENDLTAWNGTLTESGAYRIVVGGTRGNATYTLEISVK